MLSKKFLIIISIRPCILRPTWENLDNFVVDTNSFAGTRPYRNQIAHSWQSGYDVQPYIHSFHSISDTCNTHYQDICSPNGPLHEIKEHLSSYTDEELFGCVPSLDFGGGYAYDNSDDVLQKYLEDLTTSSTSSSLATEKELPYRAGTPTSPVTDGCHSNTWPSGEVMYELANVPTNSLREDLEPQIWSSTTSISNGESINDGVGIGSPLIGKKRKYESWEKNTKSRRKKRKPRVDQEYYTRGQADESPISQQQNNQWDPPHPAPSLYQKGQVNEEHLDSASVPYILRMEAKDHIIHQLPDPKNYKSLPAVTVIYAAAHHGNLIIKNRPEDFDKMNELWSKGNSFILKRRKKWFPNFDFHIESPLIWKVRNLIFPMTIHKVDWTFDVYERLHNKGKLQNKSLFYQSACTYFAKWFINLMDNYPNAWSTIIKSDIHYENQTKALGFSPQSLLDTTLHLEFGATRTFWVNLGWEIYERWLQEYDQEFYSCLISSDTHQITHTLKIPYGYDIKKSMILEKGPYSKEEFEYYVSGNLFVSTSLSDVADFNNAFNNFD
ncbi:uncharacterized protein MELLADRAFT_69374 [Melampsora larici-populina 98AG31]|uniref:Uncharacterized protein n=1 Tax=Melampsora larici-populina (strain 98AG31 / pathotype 3-4-7) TaxID=747676 RepID=F4SAH2_MELLP|nr:uncharacterized protein MELLADRAFT_69374 [Melampsora larici-populina 98AG31]EGF98358.1 hypothetical protein MELLADRAFT_69374 [Melampsora larici-populina 98AG31]